VSEQIDGIPHSLDLAWRNQVGLRGCWTAVVEAASVEEVRVGRIGGLVVQLRCTGRCGSGLGQASPLVEK